MAAEDALNEDQDIHANEGEGEGERERSTIGFPYQNLDDAVELVKALHGVGGSSCELEQLAAKLSMASNGGGFRQRLLSTKMFGMITYGQGRANLTAIGTRICDPKQEKMARVDAFLTVPLYRAVYEKFKQGSLPPVSGLEAEMVTMGVAKKVKDKARQVFQRSAQQAGFFWSGQDRLVMPPSNGRTDGQSVPPPPPPGEGAKPRDGESGGGGEGGGNDPAIQGLLKRLPATDTPWPLEKQVKWLLAVSHAFDVIYPRDNDERSLKIEIVKD